MKKNQMDFQDSSAVCQILPDQSDIVQTNKRMKEDFLLGLEELSMDETEEIAGGESLWYWMAYGAGRAANFITNLSGQ